MLSGLHVAMVPVLGSRFLGYQHTLTLHSVKGLLGRQREFFVGNNSMVVLVYDVRPDSVLLCSLQDFPVLVSKVP